MFNISSDEMYIVDTLKVERWVNEAKCPTRVEVSVANKNQGLREGFKWLVKSIIAHLPELAPRVELDVEEERVIEDMRRADVRKRMEEKRRRQKDEIEEEDEDIPGFVPIEQYNNSVSRKTPMPPPQPNIVQNEETEEEPESTDTSSSPNPSIRVYDSIVENDQTPSPPPHPTPSQNSIACASPPNPPPPPQPGPGGPPPQPAPAGTPEQVLSAQRSPNVTQANGVITILPNLSPIPHGASIPPTLQNSAFTEYSPRTPLPPIENSLPSPFHQLTIDSEALPDRLENTVTSNDNRLGTEDTKRVVIGRESIDSDAGMNMNGNLNHEGTSDTSSVFESKRNSLTGSVTSQGGHNRRNSSASSCGTRKLELEPISRAKTKSVLKKVINNNYKTTNSNSKSNSVSSSADSKPSSSNAGSRASSAYKSRRASIVFKPIVNW